MTPTSPEDGITALTYEAALAELDTLITKLEGGSIALEDAIGTYERGVVLAQYCAELLERTEQRVKQLVVSASGAISERPLETAPVPAAETTRSPSSPVMPARSATLRIDPDDVPF
jgi:exodeoxyribonuclease VII small subunit